MSEGDVSLIRDEDVLRRMWQQTEDFSKKKEIRAHMYRLREERLRSLYSPEPPRADTKGCEFTSAQGHVNSFADQNFQSMKSKEVRDAGSPPKEFTFRGQDLKEYSNAGWNVEREERSADEGRTQTRALHADVAGRYDVPGGAGAFAARDALRETRSEHSDAAGSVRRHETAASSTLAERVERTDPDHSHHTTTNSSSSSSSRVQQVSSTKHESVPYMTEQDHDLSRHTTQYDTNRNENVTRTTNRNDYEQNVRRTESDHGELVSRKVEYPDDNTRVTVETRCLPDGTRVTSTRREFRVPAQASRTSTESRSYSAQQKSDTRESSSKVTRHAVDDRREDIVDSQRQHDDHDFKRQIREYVVSDNDNTDSQQRSDQSHQTSVRRNVTDHSRTENNVSKTSYDAKITNKVTDHSTASLVESTNNIQRLSRQRYDDSVDQTDRREVIRDDYVPPKDVKDVHHERTTVEDHITKDKKVEEVVERKTSTDRYQTTYQSDYQQKKVSNDWSPSQQAWASSLRADTPSTTRPSTRASSPGGRTFESSTSSLRSSVSPDKTYRKPNSRGGSPNKIDRGSPTRTVTSDRYSSTHSTYSTTETKTNKKYSSPERKPPSGLSPTRPGYSPERKPQDERSPRSSMSPEKTPQNVTSRPSVSPDRKPKPNASGESPKTTPTRAAGLPSDHPSRSFSPDKAPRGPEGSPERDIGYQQPSDAETPNAFNKRPSMSPDRKPGYMRPTAASQPTPEVRKPSQSPDRKQQYTKTDKVIDEHYKFIDEESKTHIRNEKTNVLKQFTSSKPSDSKPQEKTPSARGKSPEKAPKSPSSPVGKGRSSSPQKRTPVVTENDDLYGHIEKSFEIVTDEQDVTINTKQDRKYTPKNKNAPSRETSPSKYDTYDKKKSKETVTVNMSTLSTEETEQFDSLTRNETITKKSSDRPSPARKSPGRSPVSVRDNDTKHKQTTDFISTEIMTEEVNKKSTSKEHPRQLVTPSSSPTRKPKQTETEPSTGQSSPTTSVSGFIYFGSPRNEMPQVTDLDDHYEPAPEEESPEGTPSRMRPDSLEVKRSPSPSKIPCKSPSPAPIKEKLPRKSSLKKPKDVNLASPIEKPPTSFQVSPTEDRPLPEHNIVKKDKPEEPIADSPKPKPPLQRRETYEDRCRKILGMVDDTTTETITKETRRSMRRPNSVPSSPSVSPCESPAPKESFPFPDKVTFTETDMKSNISDFITREKTTEIHNNVTPKQPSRETSQNKLSDIQNVKNSVHENERTEVKDKETTTTTNIMNNVTHTTSNRIIEDVNKLSRSSESPEKPKVSGTPRGSSPSKNARPIEAVVDNKRQSPRRASPEKLPVVSPVKESSPTRTNPKRTPGYTQTFTTTTEFESSSTADIKDTLTEQTSTTKRPTRVLESPTRQIPTERNDDQLPKSLRSPTKPSSSPERKTSPKHGQDFPKGDKDDEPTIKSPGRSRETTPGYMRTTTAISSKFDTNCTTEDIETVTSSKTVERKQSVSKTKSPIRKPSQESPRTKSPTKTAPKRPDHSPDHKPDPKRVEIKNEIPETKQPRELPGYMRTTTSTVARKDSTTTEEIHEITSIKTDEKQTSSKSSVSPTRRPSQKKLETSPDRKPSYQRPASPSKDESKPRNDPRLDVISPTPCSPDSVPGYMRTTESVSSKFEHHKQEQDVKESVTSVIEKHHEKRTKSPVSLKDEESPCVSPSPRQQSKSPDRKDRKPSEDTQSRKPKDQHPTDTPKIPGYMKTTTSIANKFDITSTTDDVESTISLKTIVKETPEPTEHRSTSPKRSDVSPQRKIDRSSPAKDSPKDVPLQSKVTDVKPPSYMKPTAAVATKYEIKTATIDTDSKKSTNKSSTVIQNLGKTQEPKPRVPAPSKKISIVTEVSTDFILSEKEQEILDRVQKSLRKLSPDRKEKSPSRERSPTKFTTSLQDLDITATETVERNTFTGKDLCEVVDEHVSTKPDVAKPSKSSTETPKDRKPSSKPSSRNVSPIKKPVSTTAKFEKSPDSPTKTRSVSPKKPVSQERPQSPQKPSGIKPREQIPSHLTRKPTPATLKVDKMFTDVRKTNGVTRQNVATKTTVASKTTSSTTKHISPPTDETPKNKDITSPKKETVTRTTSDTNIKPKKTSPQRMRSKPEIQISDMSPKSPKNQKSAGRELQSKLPIKPKSATSLNTSTDDDDVIIDVQQSKSSRENSPDRICPTPINFAEDVGTPRFPDEVSEPDDEYRKRSYNTIHEAESVVDDIVEICEDEELFMKQSDMDTIIEADDSLLSVHDKVNKYTKQVGSVSKPKDTTISFKDTEIRVHSDFMDENLKSDECMLTVSEKVNKFAKDQRDTKDKSPSRKITDEYDKDTIYTDDYTKLSVNDKAHLFVETAENIKTPKQKPAQKIERPDLSNVDESLKKDECLLSVSDKVNKFVKTAEQFLTENVEVVEKDKKIKEKHYEILKKIVDDEHDIQETPEYTEEIYDKVKETKDKPSGKQTPTMKHQRTPKTEPLHRKPTVKITTLRSSEAVKKAKALFENIATTQKSNEVTTTKTTKLTDIGVIKKSPKTDSTTALHPSVENISPAVPELEIEVDTTLVPKERPASGTPTKQQRPHVDDRHRSSPNRLTTQSPDISRPKSPMRQSVEVTTKTVLTKHATNSRPESPNCRPESPRPASAQDKPDKTPGYLRPTKTSQIKEEAKVEDYEVSSRRGSGKFGVELRRTSVERSTVSSERRRSVDHHQPCIEDIFDLDLLEQMLEKVVGYEQRRRIRAQIRIVKNTEHVESSSQTKTTSRHATTVHSIGSNKPKSPERLAKSPERAKSSQKNLSPDRLRKSSPQKTVPDRSQPRMPLTNGHSKEPTRTTTASRLRPHSPEKLTTKSVAKSPTRHPSPEKKRTVSPTKLVSKPKQNRFNEYASAYMKKVGLNDADKVKFNDTKTKKTKQTIKHETQESVQEFTTTKSFSERTSSKDVIEVVHLNGKRSPSPENRERSAERKAKSPVRIATSPVGKATSPVRKATSPVRKATSPVRKATSPVRKATSPARKASSPERKAQSSERLHQRTPSPDFKRPVAQTGKETIIKTIYDIEKKIPQKQMKDEKPSWVMNRNLKKITSETRTYSSKKIETEKPKYRAASPSKVISKPIDVITSSYGPGPLDADGKPLFGIKALRNGASNFQVKGTVIRQEFHSRNGGEPEGVMSVTAYSSQPEELSRLMAAQGLEPPAPGLPLTAVTTTKTFGGDTGTTYSKVHTKEERASLEQFTHSDRKMESMRCEGNSHFDSECERSDRSRSERVQEAEGGAERWERRQERRTARQGSVRSLTERFIKTANEPGKVERAYPKAGLILRSARRGSLSSEDAPGLARADSEHSLGSSEEVVVTKGVRSARGPHGTTTTTTTTTTTRHEPGRLQKTTTVVQEPAAARVTTTRHTERSFLDSTTKVTGVQDILTRMKNADIVVQEGDSCADAEARALLNKFLGATVLMAGMQGYVQDQPPARLTLDQAQEQTRARETSSRPAEPLDLDTCWDESLLRNLLEQCTDYEQRRRLRARIRALMAEQEACAGAVTAALGVGEAAEQSDTREEEEVTVSSSVRRNSSEKTVSSSTTTIKSSQVSELRAAPKPVSPFAKFRQLEKQNSTNSPNSPKTPQSPGSPSQPYFKFTDPALQTSALTIKERLLQWCRDKTRDYENVKLENFSTSWADGLAFCALVHHFLPEAFDYSQLSADKRRHNFTLAFKVADEKAGIYPLLDVEDMVAMRKPDWKCVFTYVQSIHRRFKDEP